MTKFINFIINVLIYLFKFIFILFVVSIIFLFIFSAKNGVSIENTISYFHAIGEEFINSEIFNKDNENIVSNDNDIETSTIITSSNNNFYYQQLNDTAKTIYDSLENNIDNLKKENFIIDYSTTFNDLLNETTGQYTLNKAFQSALDAFFYDHPEIFYIDISKISLNINCISIGPLKTYTVEITPSDSDNYLNSNFSSEKQVNDAIAKIENFKNNLINNVSEQNVYNKIKTVHDILVNSVEYDSNSDSLHSHNVYGALVEKKVVCEGYARAFKYLLDSLNIECILVCGTATNSSNQPESHMWNYVKLNNSWYGVDVTWDDPIIIGGTNKKNLRHNYFLKGRYTFNELHFPSGKISDKGMFFSIPDLSSSNYR